MSILQYSVRDRLLYFIRTREAARHNKEVVGGPGPHVEDCIIGTSRFCNVNREHDAVTIWVKDWVRDVYAPHGMNVLVPQVLAARIFNEPKTLTAILPVVDVGDAVATLKAMRAEGQKIMRGAYMMPVHGSHGGGKTVEEYYLAAVGEALKVDWTLCESLASVAERLIQLMGIGDFLANQVCADLRYTKPWETAPDWDEFVLCGPGSRRGIDRYDKQERLGVKPQAHYGQRVLEIREEIWPDIDDEEVHQALRDPNNLSNCFCEFDKFERALRGEATLRRY